LHLIVEGILHAERDLRHAHRSCRRSACRTGVHYLDVSFDESLHRHATR
jgi:hypothetical protein